jgi:hypothetical protein
LFARLATRFFEDRHQRIFFYMGRTLGQGQSLGTSRSSHWEMAPAKETQHDRDGEILPNKQVSKIKAKTGFYCKTHGPGQHHNINGCKVINAEIKRLKGQKPSFYNQQDSSSGNIKKTWTENKKCPATSYTTKQLKKVVCMMQKKAMEDAKTKFDAQLQDELHALEIRNDVAQELQKM